MKDNAKEVIMNKQKERLEIKLVKVERVLKALSNNDLLQPEVLTEASELLLDYKHRLKNQKEAQRKITPEKRLEYTRKYRAKQKLQSNVANEIEKFLK